VTNGIGRCAQPQNSSNQSASDFNCCCYFFFFFFFPLSFVIHHQHFFTSTRIFFSFFFFFFCFAEILVCPLVQYLKRLVDSHSLASARMFIRNDNDNNNVIRVYSFSFLRRRRWWLTKLPVMYAQTTAPVSSLYLNLTNWMIGIAIYFFSRFTLVYYYIIIQLNL
jgi:hypothetical protein